MIRKLVAVSDDPKAEQCVVALGEALIRLTSGRRTLRDTQDLQVDVGGSELNVLTALSQLGHRARWVTYVGGDPMALRIIEHAQRFGVQVASKSLRDTRTPLYFAELGSPPRSATITYDRANSALASSSRLVFDWPALLSGAKWFHSTGITLALGSSARQETVTAFKYAHEKSIPTSFDLNHREQLWSWAEAHTHYLNVLSATDVLFASPHDLQHLTKTRKEGRDLMIHACREFELRAVVVRTSTLSPSGGIAVQTTVCADGEFVTSGVHSANPVDPIGSGDAAAAAFLAAALQGESWDVMAERSSWACADKLTIPGDTWMTTPFSGAPVVDSRLVNR